MIGDGKTVLDLSENFYTECNKHFKNVLEGYRFERHFNGMEDSDHLAIMMIEHERDEEYDWFRKNAPYLIPQVNLSVLEYLMATT